MNIFISLCDLPLIVSLKARLPFVHFDRHLWSRCSLPKTRHWKVARYSLSQLSWNVKKILGWEYDCTYTKILFILKWISISFSNITTYLLWHYTGIRMHNSEPCYPYLTCILKSGLLVHWCTCLFPAKCRNWLFTYLLMPILILLLVIINVVLLLSDF